MYIINYIVNTNIGDKMKENEINVLDELSKGCSMGIDAISFIKDKVKDKNFNKLLTKHLKLYKELSNDIEKEYKKYSDKEPHETSMMNKVMTYYGIEMKTKNDESTSKLAELLVKGTNMGIIEGRKLLNHKTTNNKIHNIIEKYVDYQEEMLDNLKEYL